jgi:hypothetical protein
VVALRVDRHGAAVGLNRAAVDPVLGRAHAGTRVAAA